MKPRKWVIPVFCSILVVVCGLFLAVRHIEKNRQLEHILMQQLSLSTGGEVTVGHVHIGFFSVYLEDVNARFSIQSCLFTVRDIKIAFSLVKLIKTRGDIAKSISKIILLSPEVNFRIGQAPAYQAPSSPPGITAAPPGAVLPSFKSLPLEFLLVRKGVVSITTGANNTIILGEDLTGKLWEDPAYVSMEVKGKFSSRKKNLFMSAAFSRTGRNHSVSLRLTKAQITKPLKLPFAQITGGIVDGVFEFSFPDSVSAKTLESNGWIRVSKGACLFDSIKQEMAPIGLHATLSNTRVRIDSLATTWNNMTMTCQGEWDLATLGTEKSELILRSQGIRPELLTFLPPATLKNLSGTGWLELRLLREKNDILSHFTVSAGGVSVMQQPVSTLYGCGEWEDSHITIDTLLVRGPAFFAKGNGMLNYKEKPVVYSLNYEGKLDSLALSPVLNGQILIHGGIHGLGNQFYNDMVLSTSKSIVANGIPLGAPELKVSMQSNRPVFFSTSQKNRHYFSLEGTLDSLNDTVPFVNCRLQLGAPVMKSIVAKMMQGSAIDSLFAGPLDSLSAVVTVSGRRSQFTAHAAVGFSLFYEGAKPRLRGGIDIQCDKVKKTGDIQWQLVSRGLAISDSLVPIRGDGSFFKNTVIIDSLSLLNGIKAAGFVKVDTIGSADVTVRYNNVHIEKIAALALPRNVPPCKGILSGISRVSGPLKSIKTDSELHLRSMALGSLNNIETDLVIATKDSVCSVLPLVIRRNGQAIILVDTITTQNGLHYKGTFQDVDIYALVKDLVPEDFSWENHELTGVASGKFYTDTALGAFPSTTRIFLQSSRVSMDKWQIDSLTALVDISPKQITLCSLSFQDSARVLVRAHGVVPFSFFAEDPSDTDSLHLESTISGDLLASINHNLSVPFHLPVAGHGIGTLELGLSGAGGVLHVTRAQGQIPRGSLRVKPYVAEDIKDFSFKMYLATNAKTATVQDDSIDDETETANIGFDMNGTISRRPIRIHNTHTIPAGYEPITFGIFNFGAVLVSTPKHGVDIHVPGFTDKGVLSDIEFAAKNPWPEFAISGPVDRLCLSGTWVLRSSDLTFPFLNNDETRPAFNPFPYITWDFDLRVGNRNVKYFYDTGKDRKLMRLAECYLDPVSQLSLRGRDMNKTFKISGSLRSSKGSIFYGRNFDRNLDIGLDFVPKPLANNRPGFDNVPIIWGSGEAVSDTNRFDWIKLTLLTRDSITGAWSERGRFYDIHFRVGSSIESFPGETEQRFISEEKDKYMSLPGAGTFVASVGEQYIHRLLFQNIERRLARTLGLDVITIETSIASNYFNKLYNHQSEGSRWDQLAFANVGVTLGRYVMYDKVFLKWRTELIPVDTALTPQYNVGFEFQPLQYILMDVNYGIHMGPRSLEQNPQLNLELRLPITDLRKYLNF